MLSEREKTGVTRLLCNLNLEDLLSITATVTKGLVTAQTKQEAFDAICMYAEHPALLLNRRKITKKMIFDYLRSENIPVSVNADKKKMMQSVITLWGSSYNYNEFPDEEMEDVDNDCIEKPQVTSVNRQLMSTVSSSTQPPTRLSFTTAESSSVGPQKMDDDFVTSIGSEFAKWYYVMFNNSNGEQFGPQHFWIDCRLRQKVNDSSECTYNGAEDVAKHLQSLTLQHGLYFNPNLVTDKSITGYADPHGLVKLIFNGVLIQNKICVGMFDQSFGIIQDPSANNKWKIKFTDIQMRVKTTGELAGNRQLQLTT